MRRLPSVTGWDVEELGPEEGLSPDFMDPMQRTWSLKSDASRHSDAPPVSPAQRIRKDIEERNLEQELSEDDSNGQAGGVGEEPMNSTAINAGVHREEGQAESKEKETEGNVKKVRINVADASNSGDVLQA